MLIEHRGAVPEVDPSAYVAPTAVVCGAVRIGPGARVLFGAVLTAEDGQVSLGARSIVMENAVIRDRAGHPVVIGDDVLVGPHAHVNGARVGVGRAAMQIANQIGAVPIAVTRHAAKEDDLLAAGAAAVIATDHVDVAEAVRRHTAGAGADIALDLVRGPGQQDLVRAVRPGATLVAAGFLDPRPTPFPNAIALRIFSYASFEHTLDDVVVKRMAAFLNAGVRLGALRPAIDQVFVLSDVVEAHRYLEKGLHAGKIVVTV